MKPRPLPRTHIPYAARLKRIPKRISKYYFARDNRTIEAEWRRVRDFDRMDLPGPIVLCNGAFDLLHVGHMRILWEARIRARTLVVAMDSDRRVARKGDGRPIQNFIERASAMNFMPVDYVVEIDSDEEMKELVRFIRPDLRVQGAEYRTAPTKFPWIPRLIVPDGGMRTTKIVERCQKVSIGT